MLQHPTILQPHTAGGIECDAVTCCSLITALDKGGQWQMAEQASSNAAPTAWRPACAMAGSLHAPGAGAIDAWGALVVAAAIRL
jgi:hypothetical protein